MTTSDLFTEHSVTQHAKAMADYLPNGRPFESKNILGSIFNSLLLAKAAEFKRFEDVLRTVARELDPQCADELLPEWEQMLGIPDDCFSGTGTIEERRAAVIVKYAQSNVQTEEDFIALAATLGFEIEIEHGIDQITFPVVFPIPMFASEKEARFTMIVKVLNVGSSSTFPLTFPFVFGSGNASILVCVFEKLVPANVKVIFEFLG